MSLWSSRKSLLFIHTRNWQLVAGCESATGSYFYVRHVPVHECFYKYVHAHVCFYRLLISTCARSKFMSVHAYVHACFYWSVYL